MKKQPEKRYIQIYTGNGKGKTTAAIGQAVRSAGWGLKTFIIQFMKEYPYNEIKALEHLKDWITVEQYGKDTFVYKKQPPGEEDLTTARKALARAEEVIKSGEYDVVVLDEICVAVYFGLFRTKEITPILEEKPDNVELILTGRYCPDEWLQLADLV